MKTIKEAYFNRVRMQKNGFIGETKDGVKIQFWFSQDKKTGKYFLNSIYPIMEEDFKKM